MNVALAIDIYIKRAKKAGLIITDEEEADIRDNLTAKMVDGDPGEIIQALLSPVYPDPKQ